MDDFSLLPDVFLPYQKRLMAGCAVERVMVVEKSRRTGYSWSAAAIAVLTAGAAKDAGGMDVFYMGYNLDMAREFIDYCAEWARSIGEALVEIDEELFDDPTRPEKFIRAFRVKFASGFKVLALPSAPRALRGMQGLVVIDEAAFHDQLEELLKAAFALLIWGGRVLVISTHNGDSNPFATLVQDIRAGRRPYALQRLTFDEALAEGLYQRICLTTGEIWTPEREAAWRSEIIGFYGDGADEELFVIPSPSAGSYLSGALIEARMVPDVPVVRWNCVQGFGEWAEHLRKAETSHWIDTELEPAMGAARKDARYAVGLDFARKGDLTVIWVLLLRADLVRETVLVIELRDCPFRQQEQVFFWLGDRLVNFTAALDATGNGMYLAEVAAQRFGSRVIQVMLSEGWYREQMPPWKAAFEDAMILLPRDSFILADHRAIGLVRGVARVVERSGDAGRKRHGDAAIASALAYFASREEPEEYDYRPVMPPSPQRAEKWRDRADDEEEDALANGSFRSGILPALRGGAI
jgi:phage FluMu gp28-like protein